MSAEETRPHRDPGRTEPHGSRSRPTQPVGTGAERPPEGPSGVPWKLLVALLVAALFILGVSALSGYLVGTQQREAEQVSREAALLQEQFDRGVVDLEEGRLQVAKQRFEYILEIDPEYPGARDLLTLAQQGLNEPTVTPSPTATEIVLTPTPTLSLETLEGQLEAARGALAREQWTEAIEILHGLRRKDAEYRLGEVNNLFYEAYRNRGLGKIFRKELAQGIYDLMLAGRVGSLDNQAQSWRRSATFYQFANSFVGLDWAEATSNFADLCAAGIWDSCFKYARSAREYGDVLFEEEEYCEAYDYYLLSLDTREDSQLEPTADRAEERCLTATVTPPTATPSATSATATPGPGTVTATATVGATDTPTGATATPTATPSLTPSPSSASATPTPSETAAEPTATETPLPPTATPTDG